MPELAKALSDADTRVRWNAALALGRIGAEAKETAPRIVPELVRATGEAGMPQNVVDAILEWARGDADWSVRWCAARAFGEIGPAAKEAVPELEWIAGNAKEYEYVRAAAAEALEKIRK